MSRIGKQPIPLPEGVIVSIETGLVRVNGPKGELSERVNGDLKVEQEDGSVLVSRPTDRGEHRALHGLTRSLINNMVLGVTEGFEKRLEIQGVGYRAQLKGKNLELALGLLASGADRGARGDRVRGALAHRGGRAGDLQAGRGRDRRADPQEAPAGALQGQGHPLQGRVRGQEGRQAGMSVKTKQGSRLRRRRRVRAKVRGTAERPRLSVFRSNRGMTAQLIDDVAGHTVAFVTWTEDDLRKLKPMEQAEQVGKTLAERAKKAGVESCVFDRGGYRYHGRVKALADGAREAGLTF